MTSARKCVADTVEKNADAVIKHTAMNALRNAKSA